MKHIYSILLATFLTSCGGGGDEKTTNSNSDNVSTISKALSIYNQAYIENFQTDKIEDILNEAKNSYILLDTFSTKISSDIISQMVSKGNEVAGYMSIGTGENWRDDFDVLKPFLVTKSWIEWEGEYFIKEISSGLIDIMKNRIDTMYNLGIKWVEFDNMDWADSESLFNIYNSSVTQKEAIEYYNTLCDYLHQKDMKCMAKSTVDGASSFDGVTYESYNNNKNWWDIDGAKSFLDNNKLVIINHYNESDCDSVYKEYQSIYGDKISFICEDTTTKKYIHY